MEKLTLKELAGYLPYDLKMKAPYGFRPNGNESTGVLGIVYLTTDLLADIANNTFKEDKFIPILYPLSMLTREIEHNGEKFVPMIKLAKNYAKFAGYSEDIQIYRGECLCYSKSSSKRFYLSNQGFSFDGRLVPNQLDYYFKLYEWHFDIHNLIGRGLAIDKTVIK